MISSVEGKGKKLFKNDETVVKDDVQSSKNRKETKKEREGRILHPVDSFCLKVFKEGANLVSLSKLLHSLTPQ